MYSFNNYLCSNMTKNVKDVIYLPYVFYVIEFFIKNLLCYKKYIQNLKIYFSHHLF